MKRTIPALLLVLLLLTGCGGSAGMNSAATESAPQYNGSASGSLDYGYGWAEDSAAPEMPKEESTTVAGSITSNSAPLQNAKLIYTADLTLQTKEYDAACAALNTLVAELGGYFETRELNQGGSYRSLFCVVRVPAEQFAPFLDQVGTIANMTYRNEYSRDVSEAYYDLEARLTTQRTKLARLQELLAKAESMEDIITIESAISDTELQIEYLTGSLRHYDSLIGYSTINVSLHEVYRLSTEEETPVTFGDRLSSAFKRGFERGVSDLEDFVISVARNWLSLTVWAVIIVVVVIVIRRRKAAGRTLLPFRKEKNAPAENDTGSKDGE